MIEVISSDTPDDFNLKLRVLEQNNWVEVLDFKTVIFERVGKIRYVALLQTTPKPSSRSETRDGMPVD